MPDEPVTFDSEPDRDDLRSHFDFGASEGQDADLKCVRCAASGARLIAAPDVALCPRCGRIGAKRALGR